MESKKVFQKEPLIKWGWVRALLFFVCGFGVMAIYRPVRDFLLHDNGINSGFEYLLLARSLKLSFFLLLIYLMRKLVDRKSFNSIGFSLASQFRKDLFIGLISGVGMVAVIFTILKLTGLIEIVGTGFPTYELFLVVGIMFVIAVMEELIYRIYLLVNLTLSMNKYVALAITSILFTLIHADNNGVTLLGLVNIFLIAVLLGGYYIYRKNVWFPIALHFSWNFALGAIFGSAISGNSVPSIFKIKILGSEFMTGGEFGFEGSILTTILFIIAIILIQLKFGEKSILDNKLNANNV